MIRGDVLRGTENPSVMRVTVTIRAAQGTRSAHPLRSFRGAVLMAQKNESSDIVCTRIAMTLAEATFLPFAR
jgi:hypothetical protein